MMQQARNAVRWMVAGLAGGTGYTARHARRRRLAGRWGIILGYHRVIPAEETGSPYRMGMNARLFEAQIRWIAARHRVVSMEEFLATRGSNQPPPEDLVVLTFDDGYRDNLTHAAPILKELGLPALFYVTSSGLTERMPYWPETLGQMVRETDARSIRFAPGAENGEIELPLSTPAERSATCLRLIAQIRTLPAPRIEDAIAMLGARLGIDPARAREKTPRLLDAADLRALVASGFTIGSHSATHPYLPSEPTDVQRREIVESKRAIEEAISSPILDFCYPGGGNDQRTRDLVREAGYRSAVTWEPGVAGPADDPYALPRKGIGPALAAGPAGGFSPSMMEGEITGSVERLLRGARRRQTHDGGA